MTNARSSSSSIRHERVEMRTDGVGVSICSNLPYVLNMQTFPGSEDGPTSFRHRPSLDFRTLPTPCRSHRTAEANQRQRFDGIVQHVT